MHAKSLESICLTLCDPMDCSPPGSTIHGVLQVRILEWDAMASSKGSLRAMFPALVGEFSCISCIGRRDLYQSCNLGSPQYIYSPNHHKVHFPSFSYTSFNPQIYMSTASSWLSVVYPNNTDTILTHVQLCSFMNVF